MREHQNDQMTREYKNDQIVIYWFPDLCTHATTCWKLLPAVFQPRFRPWVKIDAASPEEIIGVIDKCPSGALRYSLPPGSTVDPTVADGAGRLNLDRFNDPDVRIKVIKNGPLLVEGLLRMVDGKGQLIREGDKLSLCRCGLSNNKPFCDGTHSVEGWTDGSK